jgi:2-dehydro-3-deoxyphosphogluconate aldolase/(4S)-4-hydroxy-2-oxoglutarate aldolase
MGAKIMSHSMQMTEILCASTVIPVVNIEKPENAIPIAKALRAGGIRVIEITLRTQYGLDAISAITKAVPNVIVGAGSVTRAEQFQFVKDAGAMFAVSPGLTAPLINAAHHSGLPFLPGVMTPTEAMLAREAGFFALKLFPAVLAGGIAMLKALSGPLQDLVFCPTGGITHQTAAAFLECSNVSCIGGSWLTPADVIAQADWAGITALAFAASNLREDTL